MYNHLSVDTKYFNWLMDATPCSDWLVL